MGKCCPYDSLFKEMFFQMKHIVVCKPFICPKCKKENAGASVAILDFMVCPTCFYDRYQIELEPIITKMVRDYFNVPDIANK
jgi:hypothetical protein